MRDQTCCFTGHRSIPTERFAKLKQELETVVGQLIKKGICNFAAGGALGFDTLAAKVVLQLREAYPQIHLILVLPCRDQTRGWNTEAIQCYEWIKSQADCIIYAGDRYVRGCMHRRNRYLIDTSSVCVAYCTRSTGGSAYTVDYARRKGIPVIFCSNN
jgi:uncharacterized phage-like protein YoqJ